MSSKKGPKGKGTRENKSAIIQTQVPSDTFHCTNSAGSDVSYNRPLAGNVRTRYSIGNPSSSSNRSGSSHMALDTKGGSKVSTQLTHRDPHLDACDFKSQSASELQQKSPLHLWRSEAWGPLKFQEKKLAEQKEKKGHSRSCRRVPGYSRSSSRNSKFHSRNTKFHSRNAIPRLEQYEFQNHHSRSNSAIPGTDGVPHERFSFAPAFLEPFCQELGGPRAPEEKRRI